MIVKFRQIGVIPKGSGVKKNTHQIKFETA